ncbi:Asp23/Gls24 family envelope stress response protein [Kribbella antibiotica]|uniref:Asp23/Gls24 family envelope stress response protein n=1 Tax=Kribbella antibiotica TaxID=190195 RepID=A0A4R4Z2B8_9ACTN|nr:Asp23/Gls24 family envelope stress response protein [Kribbella antibiotica]TDD51510.1 Asp23/Gls24 family envelope stress response protein [Kribbella antibiotica]
MTETATPKPAPKRPVAVADPVANDTVVADGIIAGGKTSIADVVVSKIAGIATREIPGVHALGGGAARAVGMLRERIPGSKTNLSQGVSVEVGETQAAVDIDLVAEYGVSIADLAAAIRENVISAVERMTGLQVTEVNISVSDVHLDGDDDDDSESADTAEPRVR